MQYITVVLADDDHLVLQDLKALIKWENLGFRIVGAASNGKQALKYIERYHSQLLITDVKMPVMDGLELTAIVKKKYPEMEVLIISSYDEFEYAKKAIRHGVVDYLLKTEITAASLSGKLASIYSKSQKRLQVNVKMLHKELFQYYSDESYFRLIPDTFPNIDKIAGNKYHFIMITQIYGFTTKISTLLTEQAAFNQLIMNHIAETNAPSISFTVNQFVFFGWQIESHSKNQTFIAKSINIRIYTALNKISPHPYALFFYSNAVTIERFKKAFIEKKPLLLFYSLFYKEKPIDIRTLELNTCKLTDYSFPFHSMPTEQNHLEHNILKIKTYVTEQFQNKDFASIIRFQKDFAYYLEYNNYHQIIVNDILFLPTLEQFLKWTFNKMEELSLTRSARQFSTAVSSAILYIEESFADYTLTAADISYHVALSTGRLGVLFKQETSKTINEYLTEVRIKNAIYLLENTHLKIYEITEKCGYKSSQYFSQIFYQKTGKRPIDYRKGTMQNES